MIEIEKIMENIRLKLKKDSLKITVDLSKNLGPSKSGKSIVIASTYDGKRKKKEILPGIYMIMTIYRRKKLMENINIETKNNLLTITVDLSKNLGPSKSGKSIVIASTRGNKAIAPDTYMGLNIYKKN